MNNDFKFKSLFCGKPTGAALLATFVLELSLVTLSPTSVQAVTFYTNSASFNAALTGASTVIETYDALPLNTVILPGTTVNGVTYNAFNSSAAITGGRIDELYNRIGVSSLAAERPSDSTSFFFNGDTISVSFAQPVFAVGIFFNANPTIDSQALFIQTSVGRAATGGTADNYDTSTLFFAGLISDTAFSEAIIGASAIDSSSFNLDNLTYSTTPVNVPEPSSLLALILVGPVMLLAAMRRRQTI